VEVAVNGHPQARPLLVLTLRHSSPVSGDRLTQRVKTLYAAKPKQAKRCGVVPGLLWLLASRSLV
jgi:hypothetical protein